MTEANFLALLRSLVCGRKPTSKAEVYYEMAELRFTRGKIEIALLCEVCSNYWLREASDMYVVCGLCFVVTKKFFSNFSKVCIP